MRFESHENFESVAASGAITGAPSAPVATVTRRQPACRLQCGDARLSVAGWYFAIVWLLSCRRCSWATTTYMYVPQQAEQALWRGDRAFAAIGLGLWNSLLFPRKRGGLIVQ